jgi:diguanylate cyclase (GGDEF)-like protein
MKDLERENRILRQHLSVLKSQAANNQTKLQGFQALELELLTANSLSDLLGCLVTGMLGFFDLEAVSLVLLDSDHEIRHLLSHGGMQPEHVQGVIFADDLVALAPVYGKIRTPWLGPYLGADYHALFPPGHKVRSVAILPFCHNGCLIGSLNFGSADGARYTRHHAADFLGHLATVGAVCLENALNRERLLHIGLTDLLTGLHNRRYLERRLTEEMAMAQRYEQVLSCLFMDVDHFKQVNDTYGHSAGDRVLGEMAQRVKSRLRASDVMARYGGEEFAVLLPRTSARDAVCQAERIRECVAATPVDIGEGREVQITVSIGVAESQPPHGAELKVLAENLLGAADAALYRAKAEGRNRVLWSGNSAKLVSQI